MSQEIDSWPAIRERVLNRDGHECRFCGSGKNVSLEVHHIVPKQYGGPDEDENLLTVCSDCHLELQDVSNRIVEWVSAKEESLTQDLESAEKPPYIPRRNTVKEDRDNRLIYFVRDEYAEREDELHQAVADELGARQKEVSLTDVREAMIAVAAEHPDEVAAKLREWGIEHTL